MNKVILLCSKEVARCEHTYPEYIGEATAACHPKGNKVRQCPTGHVGRSCPVLGSKHIPGVDLIAVSYATCPLSSLYSSDGITVVLNAQSHTTATKSW